VSPPWLKATWIGVVSFPWMPASTPESRFSRVNVIVDGIYEEQDEAITEQYQKRCLIYTTLIRSAPIDITVTTLD
jgi:uncharacterized OsmC-like protein